MASTYIHTPVQSLLNLLHLNLLSPIECNAFSVLSHTYQRETEISLPLKLFEIQADKALADGDCACGAESSVDHCMYVCMYVCVCVYVRILVQI